MRVDRHLAALVVAAALLSPLTAQAFCRTRTTPAPDNFDPTLNKTGCFEQGLPLYHASQCVPYRLLATESKVIPRAVLSNSLARAFGAWSAANATCIPGFTAIELAPTADTKIVDYKTGEHGHNVVGVVEGPWTHNDGNETLSLATLTFNAETGEVYDADLEIRSDVAWSFGAIPAADGYDFDAVVTHEAGHFLGLAHSQLSDAVMYASYTPGSVTQRTLTGDDQRGICAIYPDRQTRVTGAGNIASTACDLSPGGPGTPGSTCGDPAITHGCAVESAPGSGSRRPAWLAVLLGGVAFVSWRARRRRS
jgi:MYXO-CTERM domain-containing protein